MEISKNKRWIFLDLIAYGVLLLLAFLIPETFGDVYATLALSIGVAVFVGTIYYLLFREKGL